MRLAVYFSPREVEPAAMDADAVVVIDVVRATTSMVEALAHGARRIYPTSSTEEAVKLATTLGRDDTLLAGEWKGQKIAGFDLGNSPSEFARSVVEGKRLVWTTTHGSVALAGAAEARRVIACAFTNLSAVAAAVRDEPRVTVLCAGREGRFAIDDALCAGHLALGLTDDEGDHVLNDAAAAVRVLARGIEPTADFLRGTGAGRALAGVGLDGDLEACARVDAHDVVPEMHESALTLARTAGTG